MKLCKKNPGNAALTLNLCTRWSWVLISRPARFLLVKNLNTREAGRVPEQVWTITGKKNPLLCRDSNPGPPRRYLVDLEEAGPMIVFEVFLSWKQIEQIKKFLTLRAELAIGWK